METPTYATLTLALVANYVVCANSRVRLRMQHNVPIDADGARIPDISYWGDAQWFSDSDKPTLHDLQMIVEFIHPDRDYDQTASLIQQTFDTQPSLKEAFICNPDGRCFTRFTRQADGSIVVEQNKDYSVTLHKYLRSFTNLS